MTTTTIRRDDGDVDISSSERGRRGTRRRREEGMMATTTTTNNTTIKQCTAEHTPPSLSTLLIVESLSISKPLDAMVDTKNVKQFIRKRVFPTWYECT